MGGEGRRSWEWYLDFTNQYLQTILEQAWRPHLRNFDFIKYLALYQGLCLPDLNGSILFHRTILKKYFIISFFLFYRWGKRLRERRSLVLVSPFSFSHPQKYLWRTLCCTGLLISHTVGLQSWKIPVSAHHSSASLPFPTAAAVSMATKLPAFYREQELRALEEEWARTISVDLSLGSDLGGSARSLLHQCFMPVWKSNGISTEQKVDYVSPQQTPH